MIESENPTYDLPKPDNQNINQWLISFLGPNKRSKLIIEDKKNVLVNCPLNLLENINLEHPLGHTVYESLFAFHEEYGCGINTFLLMWTGWFRSIKKLIQKKPSYAGIFEELITGLEYVINFIKDQEISLSSVIPLIYKYVREVSLTSKSKNYFSDTSYESFTINVLEKPKTPTRCNYNILKKSRHFSYLFKNKSLEETQQSKGKSFKNLKTLNDDDVKQLTFLLEKLSHGCDIFIPLIINIWKKQIQDFSSIRFKIENIITYTVPGRNFSYSTVINGILVTFRGSHDLPLNENVSYKALLVGGDLIPNYTHLGFNSNIEIKKTTSNISKTDGLWLEKVINIIKKLQITVLLVQGRTDETLINLLKDSVLIFSHVPYATLNLLSKCTRSSIILYLDNYRDVNACTIKLKELCFGNAFQNKTKHIIITTEDNFIQTVVICHELSEVANQLEHQFWHLVNRLSHVCASEKILKGTGQIERFCVEILHNYTIKYSDNKYVHQLDIYQALAEGFEYYIHSLYKILSIDFNNTDDLFITYDDLQSKIEGWRVALKLVILLVQVDTFIINNCPKGLKYIL